MEHCGQFALLRRALRLPGFRQLRLAGDWILNWHERLPMLAFPEKQICLLGDAWQVRPDRGTPEEEIQKLGPAPDYESVLRMEESWCGRYVLLCGGRVFPDATGLLPVFYGAAGISSDCLLLAEEMGLAPRIHTCREVLNWMPGPCTHYPEISRLLPSQAYDLHSGACVSKPLFARDVPEYGDEDALIEGFSAFFCTGLQNLHAAYPRQKLLLALTGGYDSRTLFALAIRAGVPFDAFTLEHDHMLIGDLELPKQLCDRAGVRLISIERDRDAYSPARERAYTEHTAGLVRDEDRLFYAYGQYQRLLEPYGEALFLRSSIWETAVEFFPRMFDRDGPTEAFYTGMELTAPCPEREAADRYFAWCAAHPEDGIALCDRFYWEQRAGCWLSSIEQGFDLLEHGRTVQPLNSRLLLTLLFRFPREERLTKRHQVRIIEAACPALADIPFAGKRRRGETALTRAAGKLKKAAHRLQMLGLRKTVRLYAAKLSPAAGKTEKQTDTPT